MEAYLNGNDSATAINTNQTIEFTGTSVNNGFALINFAGTNDAIQVTNAGTYRVHARFHSYNGDPTNFQNLAVACSLNGSVVTSSATNISNIQNAGYAQAEFDIIVDITAGQRLQFLWQTTSLSLELTDGIGITNGYSVIVTISNIAYNLQGVQGTSGAQGAQGTQGLQGAGSVGYFATIYRNTSLTPISPNTSQIILFNTGFLNNNGFSQSSLFGTNSGVVTSNFGWYRVYLQVQVTNASASPQTANIAIINNFTAVSEATIRGNIPANTITTLETECLLEITASNQEIRAVWEASSTSVTISTTNGFPVVMQLENVANILQGTQGLQGNLGVQGASGTGTQGAIGAQGTDGAQGAIGAQGTTGTTGNNGSQGIQGNQGTQGIQGNLGAQGASGTGAQGATGAQGSIGAQGVQGTQGLQGDSGVVGYYYGAYDTTNQSAGAINTETIITFNNSYGSNEVTYTAGVFRIFQPADYRIQCEVFYTNADVTSSAQGILYIKLNGTAIVGTAIRTNVPPTGYISETIDITLKGLVANDAIEFAFVVNDTDLSLRTTASSGSIPTGASAWANIAQVARTLAPLDGNIQLSWTTGYVNLTNGVDNQIPFNNEVFEIGSATSSNSLSTSNASVLFNSTGIYNVNMRAHLFDLGSNMTLSTTLYTSSNGTSWTLLTIIGLMRYTGTNTNQIQNSSFLIRVTSLPFYIQPRLNPSANAPFPADLGAPTAFSVSRVGDL